MFDCIIVGAGPAGATAAYHLSRRGRSVLLLEKAALPRYKPCGGGVSPQVAQWFDFDFEPVISQKVTRVRYSYKMQDIVETDLGTAEPIWMVRRDEFDHYLVKQAQRQGTTLQDETKATGIAFERDRWQVQTSREPVQGRYLIAADGARGPVARWLGFRNRVMTQGGAVETEPRLPVMEGHIAHFEFGLLKNGYVWNFPKADGYSIGSGVFRLSKRKSRDLVQPMADYAAQFQVDVSMTQQHGHPLCLWNGDQVLHSQNALLVGEAASVVDPFTAEGIRPSIFSGLKAAAAIDGAIAGDPNALEGYTQTMAAELGSDLRWAGRLAKAFYAAPGLGYRVGIKSPKGTALMAQVLCGELPYSAVVQRALRRLSGGLLTR
ncbi:geranylgeranyl reductase family protein [Romeria aff. gracilis LEGE 07310]|uniref:Geranylgeranyl reductase family protein n=1 Tax=Vasconcelosia minhoensis LEGE 07310 TaxID=915328 RepID=A0A8J7AM23_9CYAN|nr:geranylgeranyl reductase family protein [Romeria gracilis]MBE9076726.1 geranylgeranyl reductase family protein [Romeria aff. gracilis LEGE 07310]